MKKNILLSLILMLGPILSYYCFEQTQGSTVYIVHNLDSDKFSLKTDDQDTKEYKLKITSNNSGDPKTHTLNLVGHGAGMNFIGNNLPSSSENKNIDVSVSISGNNEKMQYTVDNKTDKVISYKAVKHDSHGSVIGYDQTLVGPHKSIESVFSNKLPKRYNSYYNYDTGLRSHAPNSHGSFGQSTKVHGWGHYEIINSESKGIYAKTKISVHDQLGNSCENVSGTPVRPETSVGRNISCNFRYRYDYSGTYWFETTMSIDIPREGYQYHRESYDIGYIYID